MEPAPASPAGFLVLDKPAGLTSARALDKVKRRLPRKTKVGHAGTLDPFATGVLVVLVGAATRQCERVMGLPKGYRATVHLGATTPTLDPESPPTPTPGAIPPTRARVEQVLAGFLGDIQQVPPAYSAVKVGGKRAYDLARGGQPLALAPRPVKVEQIDLVRYAWPELELNLTCGRGFYVRSLARDLGQALGVGGYLTALRRTFVGPFTVESAVSPDAEPLPLLPIESLEGSAKARGDASPAG